jgi:hypothetical protein
MKNRTQNLNPAFCTYNQMLDFIKRRIQEEPFPSAQKPPRQNHLREFKVIIGDQRSDFVVMAKTIAAAYVKARRRVGNMSVITIDAGDCVLIGQAGE